jgi:hypothetical protein
MDNVASVVKRSSFLSFLIKILILFTDEKRRSVSPVVTGIVAYGGRKITDSLWNVTVREGKKMERARG